MQDGKNQLVPPGIGKVIQPHHISLLSALHYAVVCTVETAHNNYCTSVRSVDVFWPVWCTVIIYVMLESTLHCAISWCLLTRLMDQLLPLARQPLHSQTTLSSNSPQWREATVQCTVERSLQRPSVSRWSRRCFASSSSSCWVQNKHCQLEYPIEEDQTCTFCTASILIVEEVETIWFYDFPWKLGDDFQM